MNRSQRRKAGAAGAVYWNRYRKQLASGAIGFGDGSGQAGRYAAAKIFAAARGIEVIEAVYALQKVDPSAWRDEAAIKTFFGRGEAMPTMNGWSVINGGNDNGGFRAPELLPKLLKGRVYGHPRLPDGEIITTSPMVSVAGRFVATATGTIYELKEPAPDYVAWLAASGRKMDPENPIRIIE